MSTSWLVKNAWLGIIHHHPRPTMSLLSRSVRSALGARARAAVPAQAARFESTDATSSASSDAKTTDSDKPARRRAFKQAPQTKRRDVPFADRDLERKLKLTERMHEELKLERTQLTPDSQRAYNAPYMQPNLQPWDIDNMPKFKWDEPSSVGYIRLQQVEETRSLMSKAELDREALQGE